MVDTECLQLLQHRYHLLVLVQIHLSAHLLQAYSAELFAHLLIARVHGVNTLQQHNGSALVAQSALHGVLAEEQVLRVATPTASLADVHQRIVEVAPAHRRIEQIGECFLRMVLLIEACVCGVGVVLSRIACPFLLQFGLQPIDLCASHARECALRHADIRQRFAVAGHIAEYACLLLDERQWLLHLRCGVSCQVGSLLQASCLQQQIAECHLVFGVLGGYFDQFAQCFLLSYEVVCLDQLAIALVIVPRHLLLHLHFVGVYLGESLQQTCCFHGVPVESVEFYFLLPEREVVGCSLQEFVAVDNRRAIVLRQFLQSHEHCLRLQVAVVVFYRTYEVEACLVVVLEVEPIGAQQFVVGRERAILVVALLHHLASFSPLPALEQSACLLLVVGRQPLLGRRVLTAEMRAVLRVLRRRGQNSREEYCYGQYFVSHNNQFDWFAFGCGADC